MPRFSVPPKLNTSLPTHENQLGVLKQGDKISGLKTTFMGHASNAMPLLGDSFKERVQPDVENLATNMEEEEEDDKDDALYLGKVNT